MRRPAINLDQYRRFRAIMRSHHSAIVGTIPRATLLKCAKKLNVLKSNKLLLESDSELTILMDYCIYSHLQRGRTLVQKYLTKLPPTGDPDEQQVRTAMAQDRFSMYRIERIHRGNGVTVHDLVRGGALRVVDELLSRTMRKGRVLGGRLVPFPEYWITTGAGFPVSEMVEKLVEGIFLPALRLTEGGLTNLSPEAHEELATVLIGASLQEGTTSEIEYR